MKYNLPSGPTVMSQDIIIQNALNAWTLNPNLYRLDDTALYDENGNLKSGSSWTEKHINALHIIPVYDVDIEEILVPENNVDQFALFWVMSRDDIYDDQWDSFYSHARNYNSSIISEITFMIKSLSQLVERRKSQDSDLSSTSDEGDKLEQLTQSLANTICTAFLRMTKLYDKRYPSWDYMNNSYVITLLRTMSGNVHPDGTISYRLSKSKMTTYVWVEAKPLQYSPARNYRKTIPQKAAESIALAQSLWNETEIKDTEIFGIEFSHRFVSFWHARFPYQYLVSIQTNPVLPPEQYVIMKRSRVLDLIERPGRREFARWFVGLLGHLSCV